MIHFVDRRLLEHQGALRFVFYGLRPLASGPLIFPQLQRQYDLVRELLHDAHVIGRTAGTLIVMSDPKRARHAPSGVLERRNQLLEDRGPGVFEPGECPHRS